MQNNKFDKSNKEMAVENLIEKISKQLEILLKNNVFDDSTSCFIILKRKKKNER